MKLTTRLLGSAVLALAATTTATHPAPPLRDPRKALPQLADLPQRPYREDPKGRQLHTRCIPVLRTFR